MNNANDFPANDALRLTRREARLHYVGPFKAKLSPTQLARTSPVPDRLLASLLVQAPDVYGKGWVENPRTASARQPVRVLNSSPTTMSVRNEFGFDLPGSGLVAQLGLFDDQGRLWFFGPMTSPRQRLERPEEFRFPAGSVEITLSRHGAAWA